MAQLEMVAKIANAFLDSRDVAKRGDFFASYEGLAAVGLLRKFLDEDSPEAIEDGIRYELSIDREGVPVGDDGEQIVGREAA